MEKKEKQILHLICNAHLDPVWQWTWPEGMGAALSTFRVAADFAEEFDNFVFCHNEALLYEWVEQYDPKLFERIKKLVAKGKWKIMGGWYLQPDCNMPAGESIVRQIMVGHDYFKEKFGVETETAVNVDSFGHSKGLVQIMDLANFKSYMFMRPDPGLGLLDNLPQRFSWEGYAGSRIKGYRFNTSYNSLYGLGAKFVEDYINENKNGHHEIMRLWGIGDHGGGPSRIDLTNINELIERKKDEITVIHSNPDDFFKSMDIDSLPKFYDDLNPFSVGCYTSMHKIKLLHRKLENNLLLAEKSASLSEMEGKKPYPKEKLEEAWKDLLFCEFHDILPGTSVQPAEEQSIQRLHHGLEITDNILIGDLYAFAADETPSKNGDIPIMMYNPHPYEVTGDFECEFMLADQNWADNFTNGTVYSGSKALPSQIEKEYSSMNLDWRKKVSFHATLKPMSLNRFDCKLQVIAKRPFEITDLTTNPEYTFNNGKMQCVFNTAKGSIKSWKIDGKEYAKEGLGELWVYADDCDPWLINRSTIAEFIGKFEPLDNIESAKYAACKDKSLSHMRIIEDGDVRTRIEVLLGYNNSRARVVYTLPKNGTEISINYTIHWNEKDTLVRANMPHALNNADYTGQDMYGTKVLTTKYEVVAQKWVCAADAKTDRAVGIINDCCYGFMLDEESVKPSLLRAPTYTCHQVSDRERLPLSRYYPRIDQGESQFNFTLTAGNVADITSKIDILAQTLNEAPIAVSYFPGGDGNTARSLFKVDGVRMDTCKKSKDDKGYILRLFNDKNEEAEAVITIEKLGISYKAKMKVNEIKTFKVEAGKITEVNLISEQ